jgi:flagellar biosynthesis regulator FlbT
MVWRGEAQALTPVRLGERVMLNGPIAIADQQVTVPLLTQTEVINRSYAIEETALVAI